jgi:putative peptidoglycan lipid II flippase
LFYAIRLYQLPFAILSLPITRGINPELNRMKANNQFNQFNNTYQKGLNLYVLTFFPVTVILIICAPEIIDLVYKRGNFNTASLGLTSNAFAMYSIGLLPMSLVGYYKRVLSLFDKNKYTLNISIISAILNIGFAVGLVKFTNLGHAGIALASSLSFIVNMFVLGRYLKKDLHEFVKSSSQTIMNIVYTCLISIAIVAIIYNFDFYFFATKMVSLISVSIKTILVLIIFFTFYFFNRQLRVILLGFLRR